MTGALLGCCVCVGARGWVVDAAGRAGGVVDRLGVVPALGSPQGTQPPLSTNTVNNVITTLLNSFSRNSVLSQISHCNIKGLSVREVTRTENMITQVKLCFT